MAKLSNPTQQTFMSFPELPYVEFRRTVNSTLPYKPHSHQQLSIGAIDQGTTEVQYKSYTQTANAGELVLVEAQQVHSCCPQDGLPRSYSMLYLSNQWCLDILSKLYQKPVKHFTFDVFKLSHTSLFALYQHCVSSLEDNQLELADIQLRTLLVTVLTTYSTAHFCSNKAPEHRLTQRLREHLLLTLESPQSLEHHAKQLDCRVETLIRTFKKDTGLSPKAFQSNARVERAKLLLQDGNTICDTAQLLGFSDQSHFHKTFQNYTAATPRQYQH